ncbi:Uncharacterised protein [Bordetella pertussis]|nr:Uncharacterised protein [Bordetella pertussis]
MGVEGGHRARGQAGLGAVGAAGQDDGHARAEHDAGGLGVGQEAEVLGQHVAGFQVRHHQDLRAAGHRRDDALDLRGLGADGVVQRQRAVQYAALDLAAVGHLAQRGRLQRAGNAGHDLFDRRQDGHARLAQPQAEMQRDRVAHDVGLGFQVGEDVDGRIGDEQRLGIGGHVHDEHMADAALGAQPGVARHDLVHQFVGMQAALHQQAGLPAAHQLDRGGGRGVAVRRIDDGRPAQVQAAALGHAIRRS